MKKHYRHENNCLNCGTDLQGHYCHVCGQENLEIKESFGHMLNHAVSDYFHFDHQFFHTIKPLFFSPGKLTMEYMAGRRSQYLHPIKMYIFISLVYFILLAKSPSGIIEEKPAHAEPANTEVAKKQPTQNPKAIAPAGKKESGSHKADSVSFKYTQDANGIKIAGTDEPEYKSYQQYVTYQQKLAPEKRDNFWKSYFYKRQLKYKDKYGERALEVYQEEIKHNLPKMMFVLLPLVALILKLAFSKNRKFYVEHLIFTIHLHCYFFLVFTLVIIVNTILPQSWEEVRGLINFAVFITFTWYLYRALKTLYQRSRFRTITKMIGVSFMYLILFCMSMFSLVLITSEIG